MSHIHFVLNKILGIKGDIESGKYVSRSKRRVFKG